MATVYWHHTVRIAKSMLQFATAIGLPRDVFGPETQARDRKELEIRERLVAFLKALVPPFEIPPDSTAGPAAEEQPPLNMAAEPPDHVLVSTDSGRLKVAGARVATPAKWYPGIAWTDWLMLEWIRTLPGGNVQSRHLIDAIQTRCLYKRIATFARNGTRTMLIRRLDEMSWPDKIDLCGRLTERVCNRLLRDWSNLPTVTTMTKSDVESLSESDLVFLVDVPSPSKKIGFDRPLGIVPELREKSHHQDSRQASEDKTWREIMERMTEGIAPVRVLCHPDLRNLVSAVYAPVEASMAKELANLLGVAV
jgi:hypothetical protein